MSLRVAGLTAGLSVLLFGSCAQYGRALMEFDSVTGFDRVATEPTDLEFRAEARRWPWIVRQLEGSGLDVAIATVFGVSPSPRPLDNPSGFVRERVTELAELAGDDLHRVAEVSRRISWLTSNDAQTLDVLVALDAMEHLLSDLDVDPLNVPFASADRVEEVRRRSEWLAVVERGAPARRGSAEGDAVPTREEYVAAMRALAERPSGVPRTDRATIQLLDGALRDESDGPLREATGIALVAVIRNTLGDTMRRALLAPAAAVREASLLALYRLSGPAAVPFALYALTLSGSRSGARQYDLDEGFRLTLLQVCAGVPHEWLNRTFADGPPPIEYVYDTAVRDESVGLRRVGLDALARCLDRPVSFEAEWADLWWRERALEGAETRASGVDEETR
jgi:hypothetical protein